MVTSYNILYVASEVTPFSKTGGLADVASALPRALKDAGHDIRIFTPKYFGIDDEKYALRDVIRLRDVEVPHIDGRVRVQVKTSYLPESRVQIYFLDFPTYFDREELYVDRKTGLDYEDNAARYSLFARSALETLKRLRWKPDIIHCNDWQAGLIPVYLKTIYSNDTFFHDCRTLITVHNFAYSGIFDRQMLKVTGLDYDLNIGEDPLKFFDKISYLKAGLTKADFINTVSPTYAKEAMQRPEIGCGMEGILLMRSGSFAGLLNGVDYREWNPETDRLISVNYDVHSLDKKFENKRILSEYFGFPFDRNVPIIGSVSRLVSQKGFDLVAEAIDSMAKLGLRYVALGKGEREIEKSLGKLQKKYPDQVRVELGFNNSLAHQIEAGADMFLMPSRYEPCGLNQLYSLKYGTIPIIRKTGGLADTVANFNEKTGSGTGFVFEKYQIGTLMEAIRRAVSTFEKRDIWRKMMIRAMKQDFSWTIASSKYNSLYEKLVNM